RCEIQDKYREVATNPDQVFHFHNGRPLAEILEYPDDLLDSLPGSLVESFAGTGNPFTLGPLNKGEKVVDVGSGAGFDSLIAAMKVGPEGKVTGIDMTPEMVEKARRNAASVGAGNAEFREGLIEELPLPDGSMDVAISNGVINLCPDKEAVYLELYRVLKPGGRLMIADIAVQKPVSEDVKRDIDLWTG
ncbi:MAG: methyltransferase domain-containing protein, partial [Dehalococcoidia bacterium]